MTSMILIRDNGTFDELSVEPTDRIAELLDVESVDVVRLPDGIDMWVDDEGMLNGSSVNVLATLVLEKLSGQKLRQALYGDVLLTRLNKAGDAAVLTQPQRASVHNAITWAVQVMRSPTPDQG